MGNETQYNFQMANRNIGQCGRCRYHVRKLQTIDVLGDGSINRNDVSENI